MASQQKLSTKSVGWPTSSARLGRSRPGGAALVHLVGMETEGHYIEPDRAVDPTPAAHLERALRPDKPDGSLLAIRPADREAELLEAVDRESDDEAGV